jgi:hypothetical protein
MKILTRTCYGALLQACQLLDVPFVLVPNTTLNEKFQVQAGVAPSTGEMPALNYYCIGNGGHANLTGADGFPYTTPLQHLATDAALYKPLPFIMRPLGQDLDPTTMQQYALRTIITAPSGTQYIAYYAKRLNIASSGVEPSMTLNTTTNGVTSTQPFVPTSNNLNPTPPPVSSSGVVTTNGSYITSSAIIDINFDANDVAELINCCQILFNNELYAVISEIGLCSGVDQLVTVPANGAQPALTYNEAIAVQIMTHVTSYYSVGSSNQGVEIDVQIGATEPLYGATNVTTSLYTPTASS